MSLLSSAQQTFVDIGDKIITSVVVEYAQSGSSVTAPASGWKTTAPSWIDGEYIWSRTKTTYNIGDPDVSEAVCVTGGKGASGNGISSITEEYYLSTSKINQSGGSWSTTPPLWENNKYIWTRSKIIYTDSSEPIYTTPVCSSEWEAVNNVQIGGKNLLLNTDDLTRWEKENNVRIDDYLTGFYKIYNSSSNPTGRCGIYQDVIVNTNTNYTFSINITSYCYITLGFGGSFGNVIYNGTDTKKFVYNFNTGNNTSVRICVAAYDGNASYCYHPQLELGDKATDWRTAPEDLAIYSIDINFVGGSVVNSGKDYIIAYAKLMKNGKEIDYNNALNTISETPPLSPSDGTQYYYIDTTNRNVILKQWSSTNSIWIDVDDSYDYTYKWSKMSSGGSLIDLFDANNNRYSKVLYLSRNNIDISNIFQCSIYDSSSLNIGGAQITCSDANDTVVGAISPSNPTRGQFWIDTSNSKYILKMFDGSKWVASDNNTVNVFTKKPNINLGDNYLYHQGDLWIIGDDYRPTGHQSGELLVAVQSRLISLEVNTPEGDTYNDGDWVSALSYYDSQLNSLMGDVSTLIEHVIIDKTGLKLQATTSSGTNTNFYAKLTSSELGFHETTVQGEDIKVVWLSNQEFHSKKAQIENSVSIVHDSDTSRELSLSIGIFKFKTESNGSLSLVITS